VQGRPVCPQNASMHVPPSCTLHPTTYSASTPLPAVCLNVQLTSSSDVAVHIWPCQPNMDPLSVAAGVIAVATIAAQVSHILAEIRGDWDALPGRIHALNNEVQDFNAVLHQVAIAVEEKRVSAQDEHGHAAPAFLAQIARGKTALLELRTILERLLAAGSKRRDAIPRVLLWRSEQRRVVLLQEEIKQVKSSLNVLLGASNS
jgi:hypothetical protein